MPKPLVLYYSPAGNKKANKTRALIARLGIRIINVKEEDIKKTLGEISGLTKPEEADLGGDEDIRGFHDLSYGSGAEGEALPETIPEEVMVLCGFSEEGLDRLLRELKKTHASVRLKAMLTQTNFSWPFAKLYAEISKERNYIKEQENK